jgi:acylaminoacyl-peptidase
MATMFPITDIADWTIVESQLGQGRELEKLLNPGTLSRMWEMPPIRCVDQVKAPVLLLVGKVDLRVPPTRANEYYRALKVHGKKVKQVQLLSL